MSSNILPNLPWIFLPFPDVRFHRFSEKLWSTEHLLICINLVLDNNVVYLLHASFWFPQPSYNVCPLFLLFPFTASMQLQSPPFPIHYVVLSSMVDNLCILFPPSLCVILVLQSLYILLCQLKIAFFTRILVQSVKFYLFPLKPFFFLIPLHIEQK